MSQDELHHFENDGQRIVSTNYFDSEQARMGLFYLTWNAGALRLLVPDSQNLELAEMTSAKSVVVSRGLLVEKERKVSAYELLFVDDTNRPYVLAMSMAQSDRRFPFTSEGSGFVVSVWTRDGMKLRLAGQHGKPPKRS